MALQSITLEDLIEEAAIMAGQLSVGDPMPPEESRYGFRKVNDLLDMLKTNRLAMYHRQRTGPFTVTAGMGDITASAPITIGVGGTWDTPRPVWIDGAGVIYTAGSTPRPELKMHVFTVKEWRETSVKGITSTLPRALIYDQTFTAAGFGNIYLYPVPSAACQVVLYSPQAVDEFPVDADGNPDFTTVIALPPSYRGMLISNLARIMCLGSMPCPDDVKEEAINTLAAVKASNVVQNLDTMNCDAATINPGDSSAQGWDWIGGGFS